jgi:hypothetical protein
MERILERCCALDVHKNQVTACSTYPTKRASALSYAPSSRP